MSDFSLIGGAADFLEAGFDYSTTLPTVVTGAGSSNTVGSYVEILAAASNDRPITAIRINCRPPASGSQGDILMNIAIGAAASEVDIFENLWMPATTNSNNAIYSFDFPVSIPEGVRISANLQGDGASKTYHVGLQLVRGNLNNNPLGAVDTIGAATATTDGITVNAAGTINTFGSWTEITSSAAEFYKGFVVSAFKKNGSMTDMSQTYDIGVGSAGNEEIIYSGGMIRPDGGERVQGAVSPFIPVGIAEGERISARVQATSTDADANLDFIFYGVR